VRVVLHAERQIRVTQEIRILVTVRIERAGDETFRADDFAHAAGDRRFRLRHIPHTHRAMQGDVRAIERPLRLELGDHLIEEAIEGLLGDPSGRRPRLREQRRLDADQFDVGVLPRHLHEPAQRPFRHRGQQRFAACRRALVDEILGRGVVRQERHGLVHEVQDRDPDRS
jgi:hypothetical protein